jgi:hypothetical protein
VVLGEVKEVEPEPVAVEEHGSKVLLFVAVVEVRETLLGAAA